MRHLTPEEFVDLAEGTRPEVEAPHLLACGACRRQLEQLRGMMSAAAGVDAPEPSPLFWDHLSSRVRVAVAAEGAPRGRSWFADRRWARLAIPLAAAAALAIAAAVTLTFAGRSTPAAPARTAASVAPVAEPGPSSIDDPSLSLVANLAAGYDWDDASEAGLTTSLERTDVAVGELSPRERQELERLLKQELGRPGA